MAVAHRDGRVIGIVVLPCRALEAVGRGQQRAGLDQQPLADRGEGDSAVVRSNRRTPSSASSSLIRCDNGGAEMWRRCAARAKWSSSATATK